MSIGWTDERVETLKSLWGQGLSATQVADRLGGTTKNAVLGKLDRLGLHRSKESASAARSRSGKKQTDRMREGRAKARQAIGVRATTEADVVQARNNYDAALARMEAANDVARKSLEDLDFGDCRWPVGDPGTRGFGFCAAPKLHGLPYCGRHAARAYRHEMPIAGAGVAAGAQTRQGAGHHSHEPKREKTDALEGVE